MSRSSYKKLRCRPAQGLQTTYRWLRLSCSRTRQRRHSHLPAKVVVAEGCLVTTEAIQCLVMVARVAMAYLCLVPPRIRRSTAQDLMAACGTEVIVRVSHSLKCAKVQ